MTQRVGDADVRRQPENLPEPDEDSGKITETRQTGRREKLPDVS